MLKYTEYKYHLAALAGAALILYGMWRAEKG